MTIEEKTIFFRGYQLHQLRLTPPADVPPRGAFIFFHGMGDYIDRYPTFLAEIVHLGFLIVLTDFPGHGQSGGARGDIPTVAFVDELVDSIEKTLPVDLPRGVCGHSMGGFLALHTYCRRPDRYQFAWFSSPLLDPIERTSPFMTRLLLAASGFFPRFGWSTGVKPADCAPEIPPHLHEEVATSLTPSLFHRRISLRWARALVEISEDLWTAFPLVRRKENPIPLLFTQGTADPVCSPDTLDRFLANAPATNCTLIPFPDALHEPFRGPGLADFSRAVANWIDTTLPPSS